MLRFMLLSLCTLRSLSRLRSGDTVDDASPPPPGVGRLEPLKLTAWRDIEDNKLEMMLLRGATFRDDEKGEMVDAKELLRSPRASTAATLELLRSRGSFDESLPPRFVQREPVRALLPLGASAA